MQLRIIPALAIYLGSYLPLTFILLGQDLDLTQAHERICSVSDWTNDNCGLPLKHVAASLIGVGICTLGLVVTVVALRTLPTPRRVNITESKHVPADLINYVIPYIVSFMSLDYGETTKIIGFSIFLIWIFWITFKNGQIGLNPLLSVLGWRLYEVKYKFIQSADVLTGRALSKSDVMPGDSYRQGDLQDIMIIRSCEES